MARRKDKNTERGRAISEQRRSNAAGPHGGRKSVVHREVIIDDESMCLCGNDWPCA